MSGKVLEIQESFKRDSLAKAIAERWGTWNTQRRSWLEEKKELRNYLFATDTTKTTNSKLPWKNKTTLPKLTQIRDNLHANYLNALFPNDDWLRWEGFSLESETKKKRLIIESYMKNKLRLSNFRSVMSQLLLDYIDYGNAIADVEFVREVVEDEDGNKSFSYIGPKLVRISPLDHVFDPTAASYEISPKITRYIKTVGELKYEIENRPELKYNKDILNYLAESRRNISNWTIDDIDKAVGYSVDGFGNFYEYIKSGYVEILEFEGNISNQDTGEYLENIIITVVDRTKVIRQIKNPSWIKGSLKVHVGWRTRPDNLWAMGPLDNLVGMQYRIDHLENLKADAFDLIAFPVFKVKGNVEEFEWGPLERIDVGDDGDVNMLSPPVAALNADTQIALLEAKMEEMAGAPKQAMGVRTPGEKTAYEVQILENAAGRIFQTKINNFEINLLEPILNNMLEVARRNLDTIDVIKVFDNDIGATKFLEITKDDLTANGKIRPIGARHFAARAQIIQNLTGLFNSRLGEVILPHVKSYQMAEFIEDALGLSSKTLFKENAQIYEQADRQKLINIASEHVEVESNTPTEQ